MVWFLWYNFLKNICMQQSVVVTSFNFCYSIALLLTRLGKARGGNHTTLERESSVKKTNSSLATNDAPEHAGSSPSCVVQGKTLCFLHTSFSRARSPAGINQLPNTVVTHLCQLTPAESLVGGPYFPEHTATFLKCVGSLKLCCVPSSIPPGSKARCQQSVRKMHVSFKSMTVKGKANLPHTSSISRCHTKAPHCPMEGEGLLDTSHSLGEMFPPAQQSRRDPLLSGQSQCTIFYTTIFVVGLNGLVSGTSAGSKTPFVGVYTTQLVSCCRLLKPQPGTASQVWLRAEKKKPNPDCFKLISIMLSVTMLGIPCAKPKNLWHPPACLLASPNPIFDWGARVNAWLWQDLSTHHL